MEHWPPFFLQPVVVLTGVIVLGLYLFIAVGPLRDHFGQSSPVPFWRLGSFVAGIVVYVMAFGSPLDDVADTSSFAIHMVQHMAEVMIMVPLMLMGCTDWMVRSLKRWRLGWRVFTVMTDRFMGLTAFAIVFNLFHWSKIYNVTLVSEPFHVVEHLLFFITAWFLWWPILGTLPERPRLTAGWRMIYLVSAMNTMMPISVYLTISRKTWYAYPYQHDPILAAMGWTPIVDQQLGGLIMVLMSGAALAVAFVWSYMEFDEEAVERGVVAADEAP